MPTHADGITNQPSKFDSLTSVSQLQGPTQEEEEYQPSGTSDTHSQPGLPQRTTCKIQNGCNGGLKMTGGVGKGVVFNVIGRSEQYWQNKLFDPSTPSMRKGHDREKSGKWNKKIVVH